MSSTPNEKFKFGEAVYNLAVQRMATPEGKAELKGYNTDQFMHVLKDMTDVINNLPDNYNIHVLYLVLNYLGSMVVSTMERQKEVLMKQTGGSA